MKPAFLAVLALIVAFAPGCAIFRHKKAAQAELPPAAGIEAEFRDRWVAQEVQHLMAANSSLTEAEARQKAEADFARQYPYVHVPETKP